MCVCMSVLCVRVCAFVPVIFLLDSCVFYVRMFYGPSWSDLNKYILFFETFFIIRNFVHSFTSTQLSVCLSHSRSVSKELNIPQPLQCGAKLINPLIFIFCNQQ